MSNDSALPPELVLASMQGYSNTDSIVFSVATTNQWLMLLSASPARKGFLREKETLVLSVSLRTAFLVTGVVACPLLIVLCLSELARLNARYGAIAYDDRQVGTYDQLKATFNKLGVTGKFSNVFCASMTSGLFYASVTMPFETAKNRMASQRPDPLTKLLPYRSTTQVKRRTLSALLPRPKECFHFGMGELQCLPRLSCEWETVSGPTTSAAEGTQCSALSLWSSSRVPI
eukprot:207099-Hanusia_phi.AAC.15